MRDIRKNAKKSQVYKIVELLYSFKKFYSADLAVPNKHVYKIEMPIELTKEQESLAVKLATEGLTLAKVTEEILVSRYCFWEYRQRHPSFSNKFEQARQEGMEHLAEGLLSIADEYADVNKARLKSENTKWFLSKVKPHKYGDRLDINLTQTVNINSALQAARKRAALPMCDIESQPKLQVPDNTSAIIDIKSDSESDFAQEIDKPHEFRLDDLLK